MPTAKSMMDKLYMASPSKAAMRTIDRQREAEARRKERRKEEAEPPAEECDWRRLMKST